MPALEKRHKFVSGRTGRDSYLYTPKETLLLYIHYPVKRVMFILMKIFHLLRPIWFFLDCTITFI